ncbi:MAG: transglycosylase SLT domain-containing protein [bacterium]|nr:transglycosylase SLT domain-containing protein [bacterium]
MSVEQKGSRRWFLKTASATVGSVAVVALCPKEARAGGPDKYEREPEFRVESERQERPFEPPVVEKPVYTNPQEIKELAREKARQVGIDEIQFEQVLDCESKGNPQAENASGAKGLFQFIRTTWDWVRLEMGRPDMEIFNAEDNMDGAAWLWKKDGPRHWIQCLKIRRIF